MALVVAATGALSGAPPWRVVAWNDLGMHCMDADYSVFSILPPFNNPHAQVLDPSGNLVTDPVAAGVHVTYEAVADPDGSINTTSSGKTNFWDHVQALFGVALPVDTGLAGNTMPGTANVPQAMAFDPTFSWFIAAGVPITPYDDAHRKNAYPMMRISVRDAGGAVLASSDAVLPVSDEMDCRACHASGSADAAKPAAGWIWDCSSDRDYKLNILRLHDEKQASDPAYASALSAAGYDAAGLFATSTGGTSILCARCHPSNALPGSGLAGIEPLTQAVHAHHASVSDPVSGLTLDDTTNRSACYRCHPGSETRCLRGVMGNAVAADGTLAIQCQGCHGSMSRVGAGTRQGWLEEPTCQNCHTGTATHNNGQIRYTSVFDTNGQPRVAVDQTFSTNPDTPASGISLYRFSKGHGNLQCEACHGSTHAEFPSSHANDNVRSLAFQGHVGTLVECAACHGTSPVTVNGGPHGMHPVGQSWVSAHGDAFEGGNATLADCAVCHGADYRGTVLSRAASDRTLTTSFGTKQLWRGFAVGCYDCHDGPSSENANPNHAPVASNGSVAVAAYAFSTLSLAATDADGNPLTYRVVTQPANATVALSGNQATVYPLPGFVGDDVFTFGAADGDTWSNLASVTVAVDGSFADVPRASLFASMIERLYHAAVTAGCSVSPLVYCPGSPVTRAQMAVFLERGMRGAAYVPPPAVGLFADVPAGSLFAPWIEQLANDGVTAGCGGGNYCPQSPVTRAQMAVFLTKARHPVSCTYPATGVVFTDVPSSYWAGGFIEQLWREGVTGGCGGGLFCPESPVRRDQMAAFLVRGFRLP
ncbi:MAG: S-layer homology domain-containing protein [Syntrophomonadaceae bacterium]